MWCSETDAGIVVRGAKYETAAAYANQAFIKPTIANWGDAELSDYAVGFIGDMGAPGHQAHLSHRHSPGAARRADYPLSNRFDEVDTLMIFDDVLIPWENVLFYRHTRAARLHPRDAAPLLRVPLRAAPLRFADMMIGAALYNARQTGVKMQQRCSEKLAELACYREGINAHLTAAIETGRKRARAGC